MAEGGFAKSNHVPPTVRHGSMLPISRKQYDALVAAFGLGADK
jgi:hypothetical protein